MVKPYWGPVVLSAMLLMAQPVVARDATDAEISALVGTIAGFNAAMAASDYEDVIEVVPPKILAKIAADSGLTLDEVRTATIEASKTLMETVTVVSFGIDANSARYSSAGDYPYALLATETVMISGADTYRATGDTLALLDDTTWYLVRVSEAPQVALLKAVYPEFSSVEFVPGTMEKVER